MATERELAALRDRQTALVRSLVTTGAPPPDFPAARLELAGDGLRRKRLRGVMRAWPELHRRLDHAFPEYFLRFARATVKPPDGGALADGWAFRLWLKETGAFRPRLDSAPSRLEALRVEIGYRYVAGRGLRRRRGALLRVTLLPGAAGMAIAWRIPALGTGLRVLAPPRHTAAPLTASTRPAALP